MRFNRATLALVALAASATVAEAKKLQAPVPAWRLKNLQFMKQAPNPAVKWRGYNVGPFTGTVLSDPTRPTINLFSVDVLNDIRWGKQWMGAFTRLTSNNFDATRHGIGAKENYENAAYLASKFRAPKVGTQQWGGIQTAMWNLLNPGRPNGGANPLVNSTEAYWLAKVDRWRSDGGAAKFDFSRWSIVTDVDAAGMVRGGGTQEFLTDTTATPEPETWILLGTGILLVFGVALSKGAIRI